MAHPDQIEASRLLVDDVIDAMPWWNLDDDHLPFMYRYVLHGKRDDALLQFVLARQPSFVSHQVSRIDLGIGAQLHDVGKPFVTEGDATLWNRSDLNADDRRKIKRHPPVGYDMILTAARKKGIQIPEVALNIVRFHHERLDGSGYPDGLIADAIPTHVQLFSVVDYIVGLGEQRSYRTRSFTLSESYEFMRGFAQRRVLNGEFVESVFGLLSMNVHVYNPRLAFLGTWEG